MDKETQEKIVEAYCYRNGWDYSPGNEDTDEAYKDVSFILSKAEEFGYRKLPKDKPPLLDIDQYLAGMGWLISKDGMQYAWLKQALERQREADIEWYEKGDEA